MLALFLGLGFGAVAWVLHSSSKKQSNREGKLYDIEEKIADVETDLEVEQRRIALENKQTVLDKKRKR